VMRNTRVTVAGHTIPEWAKCYCVARHFPTYAHVLPYEMPEGDIIYLCPTTHHALTIYLKQCEELGGPPPSKGRPAGWPIVVQRLGTLIWAITHNGLTREQYMQMETYKRLGRRLDDG